MHSSAYLLCIAFSVVLPSVLMEESDMTPSSVCIGLTDTVQTALCELQVRVTRLEAVLSLNKDDFEVPQKRKNEFIRFGKRKNEFIRFGKRKNEFIRFGRSAEEPSNLESGEQFVAKRKNEFIRFG